MARSEVGTILYSFRDGDYILSLQDVNTPRPSPYALQLWTTILFHRMKLTLY